MKPYDVWSSVNIASIMGGLFVLVVFLLVVKMIKEWWRY